MGEGKNLPEIITAPHGIGLPGSVSFVQVGTEGKGIIVPSDRPSHAATQEEKKFLREEEGRVAPVRVLKVGEGALGHRVDSQGISIVESQVLRPKSTEKEEVELPAGSLRKDEVFTKADFAGEELELLQSSPLDFLIARINKFKEGERNPELDSLISYFRRRDRLAILINQVASVIEKDERSRAGKGRDEETDGLLVKIHHEATQIFEAYPFCTDAEKMEELRRLSEERLERETDDEKREVFSRAVNFFDEMAGCGQNNDPSLFLEKISQETFEQSALIVAESLADERVITRGAGSAIILAFNQLTKDIRFAKGGAEVLANSSWSADKLAQAVLQNEKALSISRNTREAVYTCLMQIEVRGETREKMAWFMDKCQDLRYPLAFALTIDLATEDGGKSKWVCEQETRRKNLLEKLKDGGGAAQILFDNYDVLQKEAERIVYAGNLSETGIVGKIGMEIEHGIAIPLRRLPQHWEIHQDCDNAEVTRADDYLGYSLNYIKDLVSLGRWLRDICPFYEGVRSLHLHFDSEKHLGDSSFLGLIQDLRDNSLGTSENRGFMAPLVDGRTLDLPVLPALIEMGIHSPLKNEATAQIKINPADNFSWRKIVFGHICTCDKSPEARLTTLIALKSHLALRAINPLAFFSSYDAQSRLLMANNPQLKQELVGETAQRLLRKIGADNIFVLLKDSDVDVRAAAANAMGNIKDVPFAEVRDDLQVLLKDSEWRVRAAAANAMGNIKDVPFAEVMRQVDFQEFELSNMIQMVKRS